MAKQFTPDILEAILTRLTDKFTDMFKLLVEQIMTMVNTRIDRIETKFTDLCDQISSLSARAQGTPVTAVPAVTSAVIEQDPAFKTLLAVETEKAERAKRACNVVISGLPVQDNVDDVHTFMEFCDENLTIKPRPIRESCRRLGKSTAERPAKLRITFENSQTVEDLIQASSLLRHSTNTVAKNVYFNRDLTKIEAQEAFEQRVKRRSSNTGSTTNMYTQPAGNMISS